MADPFYDKNPVGESLGCVVKRLGFMVGNDLRTVCCKDQLRSCNIEKTDFPKLCQNKGLDELVLKICFRSFRFLFIFLEFFLDFALEAA